MVARSGPDLFTPITVGALHLPNRIVMAPMTRSRAGPNSVPGALNATYYAQRASAGLQVSEGSQISPEGIGYRDTPGIYSDAQVAGWRLVTDAVHARGGRIPPAALARGARIASVVAAGGRAAGGSVGDRARGDVAHARGQAALRGAARAGDQ